MGGGWSTDAYIDSLSSLSLRLDKTVVGVAACMVIDLYWE